jgi:hypothetical protein
MSTRCRRGRGAQSSPSVSFGNLYLFSVEVVFSCTRLARPGSSSVGRCDSVSRSKARPTAGQIRRRLPRAAVSAARQPHLLQQRSSSSTAGCEHASRHDQAVRHLDPSQRPMEYAATMTPAANMEQRERTHAVYVSSHTPSGRPLTRHAHTHSDASPAWGCLPRSTFLSPLAFLPSSCAAGHSQTARTPSTA